MFSPNLWYAATAKECSRACLFCIVVINCTDWSLFVSLRKWYDDLIVGKTRVKHSAMMVYNVLVLEVDQILFVHASL